MSGEGYEYEPVTKDLIRIFGEGQEQMLASGEDAGSGHVEELLNVIESLDEEKAGLVIIDLLVLQDALARLVKMLDESLQDDLC